ncbi:MAG: DUF448 domain-containing protein [Deltaproteobacteria bacterium]|nr:DUF448 domain-containing protein [Candidatus Anaeroferrophillacea bacterium]
MISSRGHLPERTCIVCRRRGPKTKLYRFVKAEEGLLTFDPEQRRPGRGYYMCGAGCIRRWHDARTKRSRKKTLFEGFTATGRERLERMGLLQKQPTLHV